MSDQAPFIYDPESQEEIRLIKTTTIGRADTNDITIRDKSISSKHAKIHFKDDGFYLQDLDSSNHTYLNTEVLIPNKPYKLSKEDVIQVGDKVLYWCSYDPNQKYLEMPSMTGSMDLHSDKTGEAILHSYEEPVLDGNQIVKKKAFSLKALRDHKEELEKLTQELEQLRVLMADKEKFKANIKAKEKELKEFDSYLQAKKYEKKEEIDSMIHSVEEVNDRLERDKNDIWEKISVLKNQIEELEEEINGLDEEKNKNQAMITEMENDREILKGRDNLVEEIKQMLQHLASLESSDKKSRIDALIYEIEDKERAFKEAQEKYAKSRFGKKGILGKKAS